jgi:hypothetical protein
MIQRTGARRARVPRSTRSIGSFARRVRIPSSRGGSFQMPRNGSNTRGWCLGCLALLVTLAGSAQASDGFRAKIEKWIETRQITSQEASDWEAERETLESTRDLLATEKKALLAEIAELEETATSADEERRELLLDRGEYQRKATVLGERIQAMEDQIRALVPQLPAPLQDKLEPLLVQIPDDPETTRLQLGQRLMNVLGVLAQAEKFDGTATFVAETREVEGGQKLQVRTLYWGLGEAFYVDAQGRTAGTGRPGPNGWEFSDSRDIADRAGLLLDIYEGNVDTIEFVELPVQIH